MSGRRTLIAGGHVLSMDPAIGELPCADVLVEDGVIRSVGPDAGAVDVDERIDARGRLVLPGFVDTHRHMWQAVLRGCGADQTLGEYFETVLGDLGPRLTPDDLYVGNALSALAALDAGVTTVQDVSNVGKPTPEHTDALLDALESSGVRCVFAYGMGPGRDARRVRETRLGTGDALVTMALDADAGGDDDVRRIWSLARDLAVPAALHVRGGRPVSRLHRLGVLRPGTVFIHGTGLEDGELRLMRDSGAALSIAPAIEMTMGHGLPPFGAAAAAGLRPGLSTDVEVAAAADLFGPMRTGFQVARFAALHGLAQGQVALPTTRDLLEYATIAGAEVLGLGRVTGSLTPGKQADVVVLRADRPGVAPVYDAVGTVVSAMGPGDVETVLVAGRVVKRDGRLLHAGLPRLLERAAAVRDRLRQPAPSR
ncbi:amidohydrolase family protein [Streptomyces actinomycinicus]|uniref:Amidohydrolase family protein n=1 Tax=Streptomyces actinomycinicus TaxID=1695166 RepID=A0A937EM78_9ACTN|nr:amidohydrolase family protein [Streptomyces actinomycinicus]MBL1084962.1 amidohydrolase family protein [Streptomyces actinomycinicus]